MTNIIQSGLLSDNFSFLNGSFASFDQSVGECTLTGTDFGDRIDVSLGGNDEVNAGAGHDTFDLGLALTGLDTITGGIGADDTLLRGTVSATFHATTLTGVEHVMFLVGGNLSLTLSNEAVTGLRAGWMVTTWSKAQGWTICLAVPVLWWHSE